MKTKEEEITEEEIFSWYNLVIDFERINELSIKLNIDNINNINSVYPQSSVLSSSRTIKDYMKVYTDFVHTKFNRITNINFQQTKSVVDTLLFNKILLTESDLRDRKINEVLK